MIATQMHKGEEVVIGTGSYIAENCEVAEVAFAVGDAFHGKGIGTQLLEELARYARDAGFVRFRAVTLHHNTEMLEVFYHSRSVIREEADQGCVELELSIEALCGQREATKSSA